MGYCTFISAEIKTAPNKDYIKQDSPFYNKIKKWFADCLGNEEALVDLHYGEIYHWYEVDADMKEFAKAFPGVYLIMRGQGEDRDDEWIIETYNGKFHKSYAEYLSPKIYFEDN